MVDYDEILSTMENAYKEKTGFVPDEYSDQGIKFRILAGELFNFSSQLDFLEKQMFPTTASGKYLDYHCAERGVTRKQGAKAVGTVTFSLDYALSENVPIPKGTVVSTSGENPVRFITKAYGYIPSGKTYVELTVEAEDVGKIYNVAPRSVITLVSQVPNVYSVVNVSAISGGEDKETDDVLRSRLMYIYKHHNNGTNIAFYKSLAESMDGVYSAGVVPKNRGTGTVDIFISKKGEMADSTLVSNVQKVIAKEREVNVSTTVYSATASYVNIGVKLELESGYSFSDIKSKCETLLRDYVAGLGVGGSFFLSRVAEKVQSIDGIKRFQFDDALSTDMVVDNKHFLKLNTVQVTEL